MTARITKVQKVYRPKSSGLVAHCGLKLIMDNGIVDVFHNTPEKGPHISSYLDFSQGKEVKVSSEQDCTASIVSKIRDSIAQRQKYNLVNFNCEQAVNAVLSLKVESKQVKNTVSTGLIFGLIACMCGANKRSLAIAAVCGAGLGLTATKNRLMS